MFERFIAFFRPRASFALTVTPLIGSPQDAEVADLSRRATALKQGGNIEAAIALLRQADRLTPVDYKGRARLALYLAAGGDVAAAYAELLLGVSETPQKMAYMLPSASEDGRIAGRAYAYQHFADKAVLIAKRAKSPVLAEKFAELFNEASAFTVMHGEYLANGEWQSPSVPLSTRLESEAVLVERLRDQLANVEMASPAHE